MDTPEIENFSKSPSSSYRVSQSAVWLAPCLVGQHVTPKHNFFVCENNSVDIRSPITVGESRELFLLLLKKLLSINPIWLT